jgi:hypothetical protein
MGGLGIPCAEWLAESAYLASIYDTQNLQSRLLEKIPNPPNLLNDALVAWNRKNTPIAAETVLAPAEASSSNQHKLSAAVYERLRDNALSSAKAATKSLLKVRNSESSGWSTIPPLKHVNLIADASSYRAALRLSVGADVYSSTEMCECGHSSMASGIHDIHCQKGGRLSYRHDGLRDELIKICREASIPSLLEHRYLLGDDGRRPGDLTVPPIFPQSQGHICIDCSIVSPFTSEIVVPDKHLVDGERLKKEKYLADCQGVGLEFMPFIMDVFGRMGKLTAPLIEYLSKRIAIKQDRSYAETKLRICRRLAFRVMARVGDCLQFRQLRRA